MIVFIFSRSVKELSDERPAINTEPTQEINNNHTDTTIDTAADADNLSKPEETHTEDVTDTQEQTDTTDDQVADKQDKVESPSESPAKEEPASSEPPEKAETSDREDAGREAGEDAPQDEGDAHEMLAPISEEGGDSHIIPTPLDTSASPTSTSPSPSHTSPSDKAALQSPTSSLFDGSLLESNTSLIDRFGLQQDKDDDNCILLGPADVIYCDPKTEYYD